jgi:hypothetical protein
VGLGRLIDGKETDSLKVEDRSLARSSSRRLDMPNLAMISDLRSDKTYGIIMRRSCI